MEREGEDDIVCLDESFFINDNYQLTRFTFGLQVLELYCLQSASSYSSVIFDTKNKMIWNLRDHIETSENIYADLVWPGAELMNDYLSKNADMLQGCSVIELGSGVGITGILCSRFCSEVVMTDHNTEVLKILTRNIELHDPSETSTCSAALKSEKLEWGNPEQLDDILQKHPDGFDLVLGADICFQQSSVPLLFDTVEKLLHVSRERKCRFILAYISRAKVMDEMVIREASRHGLLVKEVKGSRATIRNLGGVIYEITCA